MAKSGSGGQKLRRGASLEGAGQAAVVPILGKGTPPPSVDVETGHNGGGHVARVGVRGDRVAPTQPRVEVVFCDIGDVLGDPIFSPPPPNLERLDVFPFVAECLEQIRRRGFRLGIISNTGSEPAATIDRVLEQAGLLPFFDAELRLYSSVEGITKSSTKIFRLAAERAGCGDRPQACLFVGEDPRERSVAAQVGFRVARDLTVLTVSIPRLLKFAPPEAPQLDACIEDARLAALDSDPGPAEPNDFVELLARLDASQTKLPPSYREKVFAPFVASLKELGPTGFNRVLLRDPQRESTGGLMMDIAQAIVQNGELFQAKATDAFEEVVTDLYDGFLSAQDRKGIKAPDRIVLPPLVKWGNPDFGPYTWPVDATEEAFKVEAAVVNLPPANARAGVLAWAALGHETAGHDVLHADIGLQAELEMEVQHALEKQRIGFGLPEYWSTRIDETASDVMGILNMGPAAAIGLIGYFRGLNAAAEGDPRLRSRGPAGDPHPADILRGYLAAATVRLLSFTGASEWGNLIETETERDREDIVLSGILVSPTVARQSADIVAGVIAAHKSKALNRHALIEIQDWRDRDEDIVAALQTVLRTTTAPAPEIASGVFAAHVVAAAVMEALHRRTNMSVLFARMVAILKMMHDVNPAWGPLFVTRPSTIRRDRVFVRHSPPVVMVSDSQAAG